MTLRAEGRKFETCTAHPTLAMTVADTEILIDFLAKRELAAWQSPRLRAAILM